MVGEEISGRDLVLIVGGLFLLAKMLALSFLLMIGVMLVAEGLDHHIPKGYVYFSMAFSVFVEALNIRRRRRGAPVHLRDPYAEAPS